MEGEKRGEQEKTYMKATNTGPSKENPYDLWDLSDAAGPQESTCFTRDQGGVAMEGEKREDMKVTEMGPPKENPYDLWGDMLGLSDAAGPQESTCFTRDQGGVAMEGEKREDMKVTEDGPPKENPYELWGLSNAAGPKESTFYTRDQGGISMEGEKREDMKVTEISPPKENPSDLWGDMLDLEISGAEDPLEEAEVLAFLKDPGDKSHCATSGLQGSDRPGVKELDDFDDFSQYNFASFAAKHFQGCASHMFITCAIETPLLPLKGTGDQLAALAVWVTLLRFMGDLPELDHSDVQNTTPIMTKIYSTLGCQPERVKVEKESLTTIKRTRFSMLKKLVRLPFKKKSKPMGVTDVSLEEWPTTTFERIHFIIGHAILRPEIRDEIYCQICKQLTNNPSKQSHARGWILLALCVGCFLPSDRFAKYLRCFIKEGPPGYAPFCEERLQRTSINGSRNQPPSWMELQVKNKKKFMLPITLMNANTKTLLVDSATTAGELCQQISDKIGLRDQFGFSIYIALFDKVSSVGSGGDHVLDAISQCEQYAKAQGGNECTAPWRLFFRKEIFVPWHDPSEDAVATDLIYQQVVRGIKFGEYTCDKDEDLAIIAAQQYYIENGSDSKVDTKRLESLLPSKYVPEKSLEGQKAFDYWMTGICNAFEKSYFVRDRVPPLKVKEEIVNYAMYKWPLLFSRFVEAFKWAGPSLPTNDVIIAVNWTGFYLVDDQEQVLLELPFPKIKAVSCGRDQTHGPSLALATVKGDHYTFMSPHADDIHGLITLIMNGLKKGT